jgi:hypothetical protein|nr:MAG TPA: hypothetical protein [Caudoviricetes sp.]
MAAAQPIIPDGWRAEWRKDKINGKDDMDTVKVVETPKRTRTRSCWRGGKCCTTSNLADEGMIESDIG